MGAPDAVYRNPCDCFVAQFLSRATIFDVEARSGLAETPLGPLRLAENANGLVRIAIRPEQIALTPDPAGPGRICGREHRGHDQLYNVRLDGGTVRVIRVEDEPLRIGARVRLAVTGPVARMADGP